jgi:hypothetical protein
MTSNWFHRCEDFARHKPWRIQIQHRFNYVGYRADVADRMQGSKLRMPRREVHRRLNFSRSDGLVRIPHFASSIASSTF